MHGYAALLGLGITLIKNQIVANNPKVKKTILEWIFLSLRRLINR